MQFNEAVVQTLLHPEKLIPGAPALPIPTHDVEGIYATQLSDGVLYYNASDRAQRAGGMDVPAHGIRWQAAAAPK
jgi:hypothetical protein